MEWIAQTFLHRFLFAGRLESIFVFLSELPRLQAYYLFKTCVECLLLALYDTAHSLLRSALQSSRCHHPRFTEEKVKSGRKPFPLMMVQ